MWLKLLKVIGETTFYKARRMCFQLQKSMRYGDVLSLREKNVILSESEAGYFSIKEKKTEDKILIQEESCRRFVKKESWESNFMPRQANEDWNKFI